MIYPYDAHKSLTQTRHVVVVVVSVSVSQIRYDSCRQPSFIHRIYYGSALFDSPALFQAPGQKLCHSMETREIRHFLYLVLVCTVQYCTRTTGIHISVSGKPHSIIYLLLDFTISQSSFQALSAPQFSSLSPLTSHPDLSACHRLHRYLFPLHLGTGAWASQHAPHDTQHRDHAHAPHAHTYHTYVRRPHHCMYCCPAYSSLLTLHYYTFSQFTSHISSHTVTRLQPLLSNLSCFSHPPNPSPQGEPSLLVPPLCHDCVICPTFPILLRACLPTYTTLTNSTYESSHRYSLTHFPVLPRSSPAHRLQSTGHFEVPSPSLLCSRPLS